MRLIMIGVGVCLGGTAQAEQDLEQTTVNRTGLQVDLGALALRSVSNNDQLGMRAAYLGSVGAQYAVTERIAIGAALLFGGEQQTYTCFCSDPDQVRTGSTFGGLAFASMRVPLGHAWQLRPAAGLGILRVTRSMPGLADGQFVVGQSAMVARLALPVAYLPTPRFVVHAGPELNLLAGSTEDGDAQLAAGLGVGAGYAF